MSIADILKSYGFSENEVRTHMLRERAEQLDRVRTKNFDDASKRLRAELNGDLSEWLAAPRVKITPLDDFVAVPMPGTEPLLGDGEGGVLIGRNLDVIVYGDGGSGKSTSEIDKAFHMAAGVSWCGFEVPEPVATLFIENEGPAALFQEKVARKRDWWREEHPSRPIGNRFHVLEEPWGKVDFRDDGMLREIAAIVQEREVAHVILGPITTLGFKDAGTLTEVRDWMACAAKLREFSNRPLALTHLHHENKAGAISGAFEPACDGLLHVTMPRNGETRVYFQKARWSPTWHKQKMGLLWTPGESYELKPQDEDVATPELIRDQIMERVGSNPGSLWGPVEEKIDGTDEHKRQQRDWLLTHEELVCVSAGAKWHEFRKRGKLYLAGAGEVAGIPQGDTSDARS